MSPHLIGILGIVVLVMVIALRMPIAFAMALVGFAGLSYFTSPGVGLGFVIRIFYSNFSSYSFSVVPMFIWMGFIALYSGMSDRLFEAAYKWVGVVRGGLAMATEMASAAFGAVCGSPVATVAALGTVAFPEMKKRGYDESFAAASIAAGGNLGVLIPPSVVLIVYGIATENSIGKLFMGGILPGILLMLLYWLAIYVAVLRNPRLASGGPSCSWKEKLAALSGAVDVLIVFVVVLVGMFIGWFTPTEAGAIGAVTILVISLLRRKFTWQGFANSLKDTTRITAMVVLILASAMIFGRFITLSRLPVVIADWVSVLPLPAIASVGIILFVYLILGCFIESLSLTLITIPIFYPVVVGYLGYDPVWFGIALVIMGGAGALTPPVGMMVYVTSGLTKVPVVDIFKRILPFLFAVIVCMALLVVFPKIVTWLPNLLYR